MAAESILGQILAQGFGGLLTNLTTSYIQNKKRSIKTEAEVIERDLANHFDITFRKCMNVKTILNGEITSKTLEIYVDQTFRIEGDTLDQYQMIETIREGDSVIIIGEGGGGKSMFMRYLWLSYFEKSDGKIPFFLELRNLNYFTHSNIADFIFHSIIKSGSTIRQSDFNEALNRGEFILFLDGFDEINHEQRDNVQRMILELQECNPSLTIVVTSRSDERFLGWDNFTQAYVRPLDQERSRLLIERSDYDRELKRKFLSKFDKLYEQHEDFLSNPLLAYMMLVTFSYNPDIPRRMFQFYEQAFEALYHRHDLSKGYKRKFHCDLDKYDFIRLVSYLCLKTYYDETIEFSKIDLLSAIESVKKIENAATSSEGLINDLVQSVCILKIEGLTYTFTHRSFQEYFAAYCISRVASRSLDQIFSRFSQRHNDRVLPMVSDINPELFREKFLLPNRTKFQEFFDATKGSPDTHKFAELVGASFRVSTNKSRGRPKSAKSRSDLLGIARSYSITLSYKGPMRDFYLAAFSVAESSGYKIYHGDKTPDEDFIDQARTILGLEDFVLVIDWEDGDIRFKNVVGRKMILVEDSVSSALKEIFEEVRMYEFIKKRGDILFRYVNDQVAQYGSVSSAFDSLF